MMRAFKLMAGNRSQSWLVFRGWSGELPYKLMPGFPSVTRGGGVFTGKVVKLLGNGKRLCKFCDGASHAYTLKQLENCF